MAGHHKLWRSAGLRWICSGPSLILKAIPLLMGSLSGFRVGVYSRSLQRARLRKMVLAPAPTSCRDARLALACSGSLAMDDKGPEESEFLETYELADEGSRRDAVPLLNGEWDE